ACVSGFDCETPFDSVASTLCVCTGLAGSGMVLTIVTPMALPPPAAPQVAPPLCAKIEYSRMNPANPTCRAADHARLGPQRSCSKNISPLAIGFQRLGHDADVRDPGLFDRIHYGGEGAEGNILVGAQEDRLVLRIANLLPQLCSNLVDIDRIVSQEHALLLINADDQI